MWHRHTPVPSHGMKRCKYLLCLGISIIFIRFGSSSTTGALHIPSCPQHCLQPRSGSAGAQPSPPVPLPASPTAAISPPRHAWIQPSWVPPALFPERAGTADTQIAPQPLPDSGLAAVTLIFFFLACFPLTGIEACRHK